MDDAERERGSFAAALALERDGDSFRARVPAGWSQGRATFGGLVLALALRAARQRLPEPRPARGLVAVFPAPIVPGEVELRVRELRHGRAVSHLQAEVLQQGVVGCVLLASFGAARPSALEVTPEPAPRAAPAEELPGLVPARGEPPEFTQHLDYRLAFGAPPYSGAADREIGGWCRFRHDPAPLGEGHVLALVDAWPSPAVSRMPVPAPASSITWSLELLPIEPQVPADGWWLYRAGLEASAGGYAHSSARLWSPAGRLAALSRQAVAVFG